ncbi:hypothetical protein BT96DRAFT_994513 [Gymnopus androsaceus JB14]|uniref:Uncharacterized protein n=1 Tax=Gymnopus androsaceus JB14 TaxID=1447944 RepID=A0A6A4HJT9_9AGAR|nr:hypothetical protein BT96DRAFT_994513 [Gymnopus androsaceus JB14]
MASVKKISISYLFLHQNEISTSAVLIALLAYQITDTEQRIHWINVLTCAARGTVYFVACFPKLLLGFAQAAAAAAPLPSLAFSVPTIFYVPNGGGATILDLAKLFRTQLQSSDARFCLPSSSPRTKFLSSDDYEDSIPYQPTLPPHRNTDDLGTMGKRGDPGYNCPGTRITLQED